MIADPAVDRANRHQRIGQIDHVTVGQLTVTIVVVDETTLDSAAVHTEHDQSTLSELPMFTPLASTADVAEDGRDIVLEVQIDACGLTEGRCVRNRYRRNRYARAASAPKFELVDADRVVIVVVGACNVQRYIVDLYLNPDSSTVSSPPPR